MFDMKKIFTTAAVITMIMGLAVASTAGLVQELPTKLTGDLGVLDLVARVYSGNSGGFTEFTYSYELTFTDQYYTDSPCEYWDVANDSASPFYNADDVAGFFGLGGTSSSPLSSDPIYWVGGMMTEGQTVTFSYKSRYAPMMNVFTVTSFAADGGRSAVGDTIGMSGLVPEPGAFAVLAMGLAGIVPVIRRRK